MQNIEKLFTEHTDWNPEGNERREKNFDYYDMVDFARFCHIKNGEAVNGDLKNMLIEVKDQAQSTGRVPKKLLDRIVLTLEENALQGL